jgi:class 3 adenylate cyclase/tetratricopeptide (TPR) repeat protein
VEHTEALYQRGRAAFDQRDWAQAISYAGRALATNPTHGGALNLVVAARQQLDLAADPQGERRVLTVLMADLVGSTRLPRLLGPEGYREVLLALHAICVTAITTYEGRVAQYLGDGILAYFSYPEAHEDDARRAVLAGLDIVNGLAAHRQGFTDRFGVDIQVRVGIDTGLVVIGALGAGDWTTGDSIVGDPPNVASRIQHLARPNTVVVSDVARRLVERHIALRAGRPRNIRGLPSPVVLHRALGPIETSAAHSLQPSTRTMVGREAETARLREAWAAVLAGERRCIHLVGEAGIGKSRLVDHLVNLAHASGGRSTVLSCSALRRHVPFHPFVTALRGLLGIDSTSSALTVDGLRERLAQFVPTGIEPETGVAVLASLLGISAPGDLLPEQLHELTLSVLAGLFDLMSAATPFLLVVEDVHDADPSSLKLLHRIIGQTSAPIGLLVTSRPGGPDLAGEVTTIIVSPVNNDAAATIVRQVLGDAAPELVAQLVERADGIPLYLEELARWSAEQEDPSAVPVALSGVLSARLDNLPSGAREVASMAAVIGTHVDAELLAAVSDLPGERLDQHLASLVDRQVLLPAPGPLQTGYRFRHALLREAAYNRQVRDVRRSAHRRCAQVLANREGRAGAEAPAVVAAHYEEGAELAQALHWWGRAAREAAGKGANLEAIDQYRRALRLLEAVPELEARSLAELGLCIGLGLSSSAAHGYSSETTLDAFERADEIGAALPASPEWAAAIWGLWSFFIVRGELGRAEDQVARARLMAEELADEQLAATTSAMAGYVLFFQGRLDEAAEELNRGLASRATLLPNDPGVVSKALIGVIQWLQGDLSASERTLAEAFDEVRAVPGGRGAFTLAFISAYWAWLAQLSGDSATAVARARSTVELATEHRFRTWQAAGYLHLTAGLCNLGMLESGMPGLEETIDAWRKAGAGLMLPYFLSQLASAKLAAGAPEAAEALIEDAWQAAVANGEHVHDAELLRLRAKIRARRDGAADDVVHDLEEAVRVAVGQGARVYALRGLIDLARWGVSGVWYADSYMEVSTAAGWWEGGSGPPELADAAKLLTPG